MSIYHIHNIFSVSCNLNRSEGRALRDTAVNLDNVGLLFVVHDCLRIRPLRYDWNQLKAVSVMLNRRVDVNSQLMDSDRSQMMANGIVGDRDAIPETAVNGHFYLQSCTTTGKLTIQGGPAKVKPLTFCW